MAEIVRVEGWQLGIPLRRPVVFASTRYDERDYAIVRITDADGATGLAYALARSAPLIETVEAIAVHVIGRDPWDSRGTWDAMYSASIPFGQRGLALRAISLLDVAGWDLRGKLTNRGVHHLLGGTRNVVPVSVGGGYYRSTRPADEIAAELTGYVRDGFKLIKIPAGGLPAAEEETWVRNAREAVGNGVGLAIDTHWTWQTVAAARQVLSRLAPLDLSWVEDPLWPEAIGELAHLGRLVGVPLGIGDELSGRWVYRDLAEQRLAEIWRIDVLTVGGFTEFQRILGLAESYGITVATHIYPEIHIHCAASSSAVAWTEYVAPQADIDLSYRFIDKPLVPVGGEARVSGRPGIGIDLDWAMIAAKASRAISVGARR
jgi:D-arabinonate dehydratase